MALDPKQFEGKEIEIGLPCPVCHGRGINRQTGDSCGSCKRGTVYGVFRFDRLKPPKTYKGA